MKTVSFERVLTFCPRCGRGRLNLDSAKGLFCDSCGFEFFFNTAAAVAALITDDQGRLLMTVRKYDPGKGMLDLPGGFVNHDESAEDALKREILEELGVYIKNLGYFSSLPNSYIYSGLCYKTLDLAFTASIVDQSEIIPADDVENVFFLEKMSIDYDLIAFDSIKRFISAFFLQATSKNCLFAR